ncbi:DnaJ-domain-containing protein [Xylaria nigripes]|nr:DnaJ-domain-containing protein [Xylaria nigripes]
MPTRFAVFLLAAPAPIRRQCLYLFLHPPPAPLPSRRPDSFSARSATSATGHRNGLPSAILRSQFHSTALRRDDAIDNARNHYETLKVSPTASTSDIKKSFYSLSKAHHPDVHEFSKRRAAAKRFMRISEAYSILSSPAKRAKYDRDHMDLIAPTPEAHAHKKASYASTGPAGGRPASGLSRRRSTFQGPPPSFYRSGGWGAQAEKRRAAHEQTTGGAGSGSGGKGPLGGMGPGQDPFGHREDVPNFDKASHEATWRQTAQRREARRATGVSQADRVPKGILGMFFTIGGMLLLSAVGPFFIGRLWYGSSSSNTREQGKKTEKG